MSDSHNIQPLVARGRPSRQQALKAAETLPWSGVVGHPAPGGNPVR